MLRYLATALLFPALAAAPAARRAEGNVQALRLEARDGRTELTVQVTGGEVRWSDFALQGPARVVVDIQGARSDLSSGRFDGINRGGVRGVRTSQHSADVVRVVVDLDRDFPYTVTRVADGLRITLQAGSQAFAPWSSGAAYAQAPGQRPAAPPVERSGVSTQEQRPAQQQPRSRARPITVTFENTDMRDVLATFAELTGRSIVPGSEVGGIRVEYVTFTNQPWDLALRSLLQAYGLAAEEDRDSGIIRVDKIENLAARETLEPLVTRTFRINYVPVEEMQNTLSGLKSERGAISINQTTNTLIATDVPSVIEGFDRLVTQLDVRTPQVAIQAKIVFINRTDAEALGIVYDLKDSRGNSLNDVVTAPGATPGTNTVSLGGSSIAALGNANARVSDPALQVLTSLVLGRYTLVNFIEALQTAELSDVQAAPVVTTSSNHEAQIWVGERTPIRVVDLGSASTGATTGNAARHRAAGGDRHPPDRDAAGDQRPPRAAAAARRALSATPAAGEIGVQFLQQQGDTRVMVKDGETAVIGGLTVTEVTQSRTGIPFLMDVPFLGSLFRSSRSQEVKRDLLIMVTPHIVEES